MKVHVLVVGSSNTDMVIQLERLPRPGETVLGGQFTTAAGGKGANQAVAAARAGATVTFIASVGEDQFGKQAIAGFRKEAIKVRHIQRNGRAPSGVALIFVSRTGQNCIGVAGGANAMLLPADIRRAAPAFHRAHTLLVQLETPLPTVEAAIRQAARQQLQVILNPAPAQPLSDNFLRRINVITPNESEAEQLTGIRVSREKNAARAARHLMQRGVPIVILTLGARGAFVATSDSSHHVPGFAVNPVDTTAAGDVFNGALAVALGERQPLLQAVRFANAAAAISVTRLGAQPSAPHRREIERLLKTGSLR